MIKRLSIISLFAVAACGATGGGWLASNGLLVQQTSDITFDIPFRGLSGDSDFWCAAGEYTIRGLNLNPTTRIYRTTAPPRASGEGVSFSLSAVNATDPGVIAITSDGGLSAEMARQFCERNRRLFDD